MSGAVMLSLLLRRKIGLKEKLTLSQSLSVEGLGGILSFTKFIIFGTFLIEGIGAFLLSMRFVPDFGFLRGLWKSVFISISAFCNAGFDLMGEISPFSSLTAYSADIYVNIIVCALIIIGGLGFFVWADVLKNRRFKKLNIYSRAVLILTVILIVGGAAVFFIMERSNPQTLLNMPLSEQVTTSFFQSVTARTAGFNTVNLSEVKDTSVLLLSILMFIGGASGSTAGGVKIVTVGLLFYVALKAAQGETEFVLERRTISPKNIYRALALVFIGICVIAISVFLITTIDDMPLRDVLFEVVSAFGTVGLSTGITATLSAVSKVILIVLMFFGRVGLLTITFALSLKMGDEDKKIKYPELNFPIG